MAVFAQYERQLAEHHEKNNRLQRRLTQAEQRATAATQQVLTPERRATMRFWCAPTVQRPLISHHFQFHSSFVSGLSYSLLC